MKSAESAPESIRLVRRIHRLSLVIITLAIIVPIILAAWLPAVSLYTYLLAVIALVWIGLVEQSARDIAVVLLVIPLTNILIISLPPALPLGRSAVMYGVVGCLAVVYSWLFRSHPTPAGVELTSRQQANVYSRMVIIGGIAGIIIYLAHGYRLPTGMSLLMVTLLAPLAALAEELFFRNLLQRRATAVMRDQWAMLLAALVYTAMLADFHSIIQSSLALFVGLALALAYYVHRTVLFTFVLNTAIKLSVIGAFVLLER
jgi:membrane protease YdiL (CAAX protease family)